MEPLLAVRGSYVFGDLLMVANAGKACSFTLRFVFVCALDQEALSLGGD